MVTLPRSVFEEILAHAQGQPDQEVCGILSGRDGQVEQVYRARNVAETPRTRFKMDPYDILKITDEIDAADGDLVGFYHSHTHTQAYPSPTDVADWPARWYPDALCLICSLMEEDRPQLRAFHIDEDGKISEEAVTVG
jgi:proteasome lid subunit RPN8/RPN11